MATTEEYEWAETAARDQVPPGLGWEVVGSVQLNRRIAIRWRRKRNQNPNSVLQLVDKWEAQLAAMPSDVPHMRFAVATLAKCIMDLKKVANNG